LNTTETLLHVDSSARQERLVRWLRPSIFEDRSVAYPTKAAASSTELPAMLRRPSVVSVKQHQERFMPGMNPNTYSLK